MNPTGSYVRPYVRTPTVKDRHRLPIQCVVRNSKKHEWKPALLVDIFAHASQNFAVVPSDAPPADVIAGKVQVELYRECLIRNKAPTPAESIVDPPPVPQGTSPEISKASGELAMLIALDAKEKLSSPPKPYQPPKFKLGERVVCGPPEDVVYIRAIHTFDEVYGWKYAIDRYSDTNISKLIDQADHIPEDIIQPYIPPVPTPQENNTVVNEQGGRQSHLDARFDCIPPVVLRLLAQCLGFGARKYGKDNWKNIPQWDHLNHAVNHINEWNRGNRDEPHLVNAMARLTFALWQAVDTNQQPDTYQHPDQLK